ncbi:MAG TPA: carboxypeptidase regulatory-like domain-containing protein [Vicinamibacterales bacterium]
MIRRAFLAAAFAIVMFQAAGAQAPEPQTRPAASASAAPAAPITKLPVRRVVLYKNGVGYFEHVGRVRGSQSVAIDLNTAQLNDVLKSLTTLDLGDGRIADVSFNSDTPFAQRLRELTLPLGEKTTLPELLGALRGARLEVRTGEGVIAGRLLSVERRQRKDGTQGDQVTLVTAAGDLRSVALDPGVSVKLAEHDSAEQVGAYLGLLASNRAQDHRRLTIATVGTAARDVMVSYISEVPIWKTTYRVVLPTDGKAILQGWAVVDNTIGEDWDNVELSLVAGAPQSFVQPLSQPVYGRRPVVAIAAATQSAPQLHQDTLTQTAGDVSGRVVDGSGSVLRGVTVTDVDSAGRRKTAVTDGSGRYSFRQPTPGANHLEFELAGFDRTVVSSVNFDVLGGTMQDIAMKVGSVAETLTVTAESPRVDTPSVSRSSSVRLGGGGGIGGGAGGGTVGGLTPATPATAAIDRAAVEDRLAGLQAAADGQRLGDLFEYRVKGTVTIRRNQSALVPILRSDVGVERVSLWNERRGARPLRSLWLTNSSGLTLDAGSFTVLDGSTFAGEGLVDTIRPGEKRLLSYASDLAVQIEQHRGDDQERISRVTIAHGVAVERSEQAMRKVYTIRNSDTTARTIVIEHPVRSGWRLAPGVMPTETSLDAYRFAVPVEAKSTATLVVEERHPLETKYSVAALTDDQIAIFVRGSKDNTRLTQALAPVRAKNAEQQRLGVALSRLQSEADNIGEEQHRLRENIGVLKGSAAEQQLLKRYIAQLTEQEDRIVQLRKETADLDQQMAAGQKEMTALLEALIFDIEMVEADENVGDGRQAIPRS